MNLPKYVSRDISRHGQERLYFRRRGRRIRLHSSPGTPEFERDVRRADLAIKPKRMLLPEPRASSFVYFIVAGRKVKIGTARNPLRRYQDLRAGIPGRSNLEYVTPGDYQLERGLHRLFLEDRISGEWFIFSPAIRQWIEDDEERRIAARQNEQNTKLPHRRIT